MNLPTSQNAIDIFTAVHMLKNWGVWSIDMNSNNEIIVWIDLEQAKAMFPNRNEGKLVSVNDGLIYKTHHYSVVSDNIKYRFCECENEYIEAMQQ